MKRNKKLKIFFLNQKKLKLTYHMEEFQDWQNVHSIEKNLKLKNPKINKNKKKIKI